MLEAHDLATQFLTWQCRLRQVAMREDGGRPSQGMCPRVLDKSGSELAERIIVLIVRENPFESTEFLRFQVQKHNAAEDIYKKSLTYLQSTHYHRAIEFSEEMTALFAKDSAFAKKLLEGETCILEFTQFSQTYRLPCTIKQISQFEPAFEATLWHNRVFNPELNDEVLILGFQPDWEQALEMLEG